MTRLLHRSLLVLPALGLLIAGQAESASIEEFYKSKRMTLIVGSDAGGGYDLYSRVLARYMKNHIPGNPEIIVQNMPGGAGLKATNHVYNRSPRDGSVFLSSFNTHATQAMFDSTSIHFDSRQMNWIGSIGKVEGICVTWHDSSIKTIDDAKAREVTASTTGVNSNGTMIPNMLNTLIGTKFKVIAGYSVSGMRLALERGEVDSLCALSYSTLMASTPAWLTENKINILAQIARKKVPALGNAPLIYDLAPGVENKAILDLWTIPQEMGRPYTAPPEVPADRVQALRRAFDATMKDPGFLSDAKKANMLINPMTGEEMHTLIKEAYEAPEAVVKSTADIIKYAAYTKKK